MFRPRRDHLHLARHLPTQGDGRYLSYRDIRLFDYARRAEPLRDEVRANAGKCLHYYFYLVEEQFDLCYLRVPTWAPFRLQVSHTEVRPPPVLARSNLGIPTARAITRAVQTASHFSSGSVATLLLTGQADALARENTLPCLAYPGV
jgi:hypothetical protein